MMPNDLMVSTCCRKHADFSTESTKWHWQEMRSVSKRRRLLFLIHWSSSVDGEGIPQPRAGGFFAFGASLPNHAWYQQSVAAAETVGGAEEFPDI